MTRRYQVNYRLRLEIPQAGSLDKPKRTDWYIRDASGNVISIYEEDNIDSILTETEVPIYGSGKLGTYYPNQDGSTAYEITDHLGNVRALVRDNVEIYTATMEDNGQVDIANPRVSEMLYFENLFETEVTDSRMNHTKPGGVPAPDKAAYLYWVDGMEGIQAADKAVGPAIALKVNAGDTVKMEAWARYENEVSYNRNFPLTTLASLLGGSFAYTAGFEGSTIAQTTSAFNGALGAAGFMGDDADGTRPFAYLNYILFDQNMAMMDAGWERVPETAGFDPGEEGLPGMHAKVEIRQPIVAPQNGYIYVWVSNESENTKVWFDDLQITHTQTMVTQATDYGVWGDILREQKTDLSTYRFGYQGQFSEKDEETGWNHFEARNFDPIIARWTTPDPAREFWSRYLGMGNNPILFADPDGEEIIIGGYTYVPGQEYTGKNMFIAGTVKSLNRLYQAEQKIGKSIIGDLSKPGVELRILKSSAKSMAYQGDGKLGFNLNSGLYTFDGDPEEGAKRTGTQSPEIGLLHELVHAHDDLVNDTWWDHYKDKSTKPDFANMSEKIAVEIETIYINQINLMFNLNNMIRLNDHGRIFEAPSPESNKPVYNTKGDRID